MTHDEGTDTLLGWSTADLAAKLDGNTPDEDSFVLRVVAARIAARTEQCHDPLHLLKDFSRAVGSIAEAVREVVPRYAEEEVGEPETAAQFRDTVDHLDGAAAGLDDLQRWF